jgi:hypothetical protein
MVPTGREKGTGLVVMGMGSPNQSAYFVVGNTGVMSVKQ